MLAMVDRQVGPCSRDTRYECQAGLPPAPAAVRDAVQGSSEVPSGAASLPWC